MAFFRETGRPDPSRVVNYTGTEGTPTFIGGASGKEVIVYDILTDVAIELSEDTNMNVIMYVQPGNCNLSSPVRFGKGNGVVLGTGGAAANVTMTYDIV